MLEKNLKNYNLCFLFSKLTKEEKFKPKESV